MKILWLADWEECNSVILVWPGLAPAQVLMAAYAIVNSIIVLPFSRVDAKHVVQAAKQEFCWTRSEIPAALERRAAIAGGSGAAAQLDASEPMLVIETVLEALWFSMLAYEDAREVQPGVPEKDQTLPLMMQLCELDNMAAWHEHTTALHVIAAWSPMRIVVAFRGTAERANFWADMQLCLTSTTRLTDRGEAASKPQTRWGDRPAAHRGFMHTWTHARMNQRITSFLVARVNEALERTGRPPHVLLCGHSLGGALATLAAMDLREACGAALPPSALTVVTFGSPRVGSAALARHYDACVCPDHWSMVNQHDVITHGGRLCGVCVPRAGLHTTPCSVCLVLKRMPLLRRYKHVGKRVLINPRGDMIVRPDFVEASFQHWIGAESLDDVRQLAHAPWHVLFCADTLRVAALPAPLPRRLPRGVLPVRRHAGAPRCAAAGTRGVPALVCSARSLTPAATRAGDGRAADGAAPRAAAASGARRGARGGGGGGGGEGAAL